VARIVEPDPGRSFDALVHGLGAAIVAPVVLLIAALPAIRLAGSASRDAPLGGRARSSRVVDGVAQASFPPTAVIGVRMALEPGRGRSAVPVRSSVLAIVVGVLALTATVTFGASFQRLLDTPRLVGWNWDSRVGYPADPGSNGQEHSPLSRAKVIDALAAHPDVAAFGIGTIFPPFPDRSLELGHNRVPVGLVSFDSGSSSIGPSITEGRAPSGPHELLVGPITAEALGVSVGDRITAYGQAGDWGKPETYQDIAVEMEVVGLGILPLVGSDRLGTGAASTTDGLALLTGSTPDPDSLFLRYRAGADPATVIRALAADLGLPAPDERTLAEELSVSEAIPVLEVRNIDRLPLLLGVLMSLMSLAVLAHVLFSAVAARRGELALLRAIGFDRRQIRRIVAWQAATIALVALVIAVPLGIVVGRGVWLVFAERLGVVPEAIVPFSLVFLVPSVMAAALLIAVVPGRMAARGRPAAMLRTE
jgi:ABC-type lipoprotein release transport system permease subunit